MAGTGKSTIARTLCRELDKKGHLGASFFFSRGGGDVARADLLFTSLAKQLALRVPAGLGETIRRAIRQHPGIASKSREAQWSRLILSPLKQLAPSSKISTLVVVVDALDECDDEVAMENIISLLAQAGALPNMKLRVIITSRPETPIRLGFEDLPEILHRDILLHEVPREVVDGDICLYIYHSFNDIKRRRAIRRNWPEIDTVNHLVHLSSGLFVFAATISRSVMQDKNRSAVDSLKSFLAAASVTERSLYENEHRMTLPLDAMYSEILSCAAHGDDPMGRSLAIKDLIGPIVILYEPLSENALASLLNLDDDDLVWRLDRLRSVIQVPEKPECLVRLFHPSFRDFLVSKYRCKDPRFWVDQKLVHLRLFHRCLQVLHSCLRVNICDFDHPRASVSNVAKLHVDSKIMAHVQYASRYWSGHFFGCSQGLDEAEAIYMFLTEHLLHWLEVMAWIGRTTETITILIELQQSLEVCEYHVMMTVDRVLTTTE